MSKSLGGIPEGQGSLQPVPTMDVPAEPPRSIELELDEALLLVIALEDAADVFDRMLGVFRCRSRTWSAPWPESRTSSGFCNVNSVGPKEEATMPVEILRLAEAARRLGLCSGVVARH